MKTKNSSTITIKGKSGQGIQLLGFTLANIQKDQGLKIALASEYSPLVRAGNSSISLVFSKQEIQNPLVDKPNYKYDLAQKDFQQKLLEKYPNPKVLNMILLGAILKKLNLNPKNLKKYLPPRFQNENLKAIQAGQK